MKFKKPKFWDYKKPNIISYLLLPISLLGKMAKLIKNLTIKKKKISINQNYLYRKHLSGWNR